MIELVNHLNKGPEFGVFGCGGLLSLCESFDCSLQNLSCTALFHGWRSPHSSWPARFFLPSCSSMVVSSRASPTGAYPATSMPIPDFPILARVRVMPISPTPTGPQEI